MNSKAIPELPSLALSRVAPASGRATVRPTSARLSDAGTARLGGKKAEQLHAASPEFQRPGSVGYSVVVPAPSQVQSLLALGPGPRGASASGLQEGSGADRDHVDASRDREDTFRASPSMVVGEPPVPSTSGGDKDNKEFYLQCGVAIRTLREELPAVFEHDLTYDIYREDITFVDHITTLPGGASMVTHGKDSYRRLMWSIRFHGTLFLSQLNVRIVRIWQPREKVISVRWSITGNPRVLHSLGAAEVHLDGISEYTLDSQGMIYEHKIESVDWNANHSTLKALNMNPVRSNMTPSFFFLPIFPFGRSSALEAAGAGAGAAASATASEVGGLLRKGLGRLRGPRGGSRDLSMPQ